MFGTYNKYTVYSLVVKAFIYPPLFSISKNKSFCEGLFSVPLKCICSKKWDVPESDNFSLHEPVFTKKVN